MHNYAELVFHVIIQLKFMSQLEMYVCQIGEYAEITLIFIMRIIMLNF